MALDYTPAAVPTAGQVISVVLQMITFGVLCVCFTRRTSWIKNYRTLPLAIWLILSIYVDSTLFVFATSIVVHGLGINSTRAVCEGGIILCLVCYMTTKILIYYFLVERAYIVRGSLKPRLHTKLWLFNCLFMMLPYTVFVIMNFIWRITYINDEGVCIIGMQKIAMLPLITFEVVVNVYLTLLFIVPVRKLYSYRNSSNQKLNRMAFRSLVGSLATLTTSVANLTVLMILHGEPGWICLMCCNADILFCVIVLHWVTSKDKPSSYASTRGSRGNTQDAERDNASPQKHSVRQSMAVTAAPEKPSGRNGTHHDCVDLDLERQNADLSIWPYKSDDPAAPQVAKLPGTVVTEIRSSAPPAAARSKSRNGRVLQKSRNDGSECGDEVELHKIHVQREVCVDTESTGESESGYAREARSSSMEDAWGMKRSVSAEKMV